MAKVLGVGGVFFKSPDPQKLGRWYAEHLRMNIDPSYGGTSFFPKDVPGKGYTVWGPFKADTTYFDPSAQPFMINLMVDDVAAALRQVEAGGATVIGDIEEIEFGVFGHFMDPDGNKIELWEPK